MEIHKCLAATAELAQVAQAAAAELAQTVSRVWPLLCSLFPSLLSQAAQVCSEETRRVKPVGGDLTSGRFICFHPCYLSGSFHQGVHGELIKQLFQPCSGSL